MAEKVEPFVHLHVHSEKSFKDGCSTFDALIDEAIKNGQQALALTDHGTMYDAMGFYLAAKAKGIKPIIGCEVYMIPEGASANITKSNDPDEEGDAKTVPYFHLVLLAKDNDGLFNLHKLCSIAGNKEDGHFYYRPRLLRKDLEENSDGLICLSACLGGEVPKLITSRNLKEAEKIAVWYKRVFGDDYYLELQDHCDDDVYQQTVNKELCRIADKHDIPLVITNDAHYAKQEDYETHKLLKCISYKEKFASATNYDQFFSNDQFYLKSSSQMFTLANKMRRKDAYYNTIEVANKVTLEVDTSMHFPRADLSHPDKEAKKFKSADAKLKYIVNRDRDIKYPDDYPRIDDVQPRIEKELADISKGQFPDYFLNVYDIIKYAKDNGILIGAGRGSGAGSIVSNILNITDVDPLEFDLIWERFWNPGRCTFDEDGNIIAASPPDLDIDVPSNRRDEVFDFTKEHFEYDKVANICSFGTYKGRNLVRDGAAALDFDEDLTNDILKAMPFKGTPSLSTCFSSVTECIALYENNDEIADFIDQIAPIEGCSTNVTTHPAGVVITDDIFYQYFPVFQGKNGLTSQYPYETLEAIGCLKIDLLGHMAEQVIDDACMLIKERHDIEINPYKIPNDNEPTYDMLRDIRMTGIPQLKEQWVIPIIQDVRPSNIEDIIALVTMIRPGSMDSGQTDKYRSACLGDIVKPDVEELAPVVEKYNNCILYQEQIMDLAKLLGGFTLEEADELRKVCAKTKYADKAEKMLKKLDGGMVNENIPKANREKILGIVKSFFSYSFNKAHAAGYGLTSYRVAYLKANYFLELTTAQLNAVIGDGVKTAQFLEEVQLMGYDILPPDVNKSEYGWTCDDDGVRFPLGSIAGVGPSAVDAIIEERSLKGAYKSFENFVERLPGSKVKVTAIENLICVGAFETFGYTRKCLFDQCVDIVNNIRSQKKLSSKSLFGGNKSILNESDVEFKLADIQDDEKALLGFVITMTDDEKRVLMMQLKKRYDKMRSNGEGKMNNKPKLTDKKKRMIDKLRQKSAELNEEENDSEKDKSKEIRNNLRSKLNTPKSKNVEETKDNSSDDDVLGLKEYLVVKICDYSILPEKLFSIMSKFKGDETAVMFMLKTKDGSMMDIYVDFRIEKSSLLITKLKKIVGSDNVFYKKTA